MSATPTNGLVVVDKPAGWTSHDVVGKLRRFYGQRRVGHAGTLDPDATGVLLVGLGRVTRLLRFLQETTKTYEARVVFGIATDTLDASGAVLERAEMPLTRAQVEQASRGVPRRVAADPADGLGDQGQGPASVRAGAPRARRSSGRRARCASTASRSRRSSPARIPRSRSCWTVRVGPTCAPSPPTWVPRSAATRTSPTLRRTRVGSFGVDEAHSLEAIEADPPATCVTPRPRCATSNRSSCAATRYARSRTARRSRAARSFPTDAGVGPVRGRRRRRAAARRLRTPGCGREAGRRPRHGAAVKVYRDLADVPDGRGGPRRHDRRVRRCAPRSSGGAATRP